MWRRLQAQLSDGRGRPFHWVPGSRVSSQRTMVRRSSGVPANPVPPPSGSKAWQRVRDVDEGQQHPHLLLWPRLLPRGVTDKTLRETGELGRRECHMQKWVLFSLWGMLIFTGKRLSHFIRKDFLAELRAIDNKTKCLVRRNQHLKNNRLPQ